MTFEIWQINFTREQINEINTTNGEVEYYKLYSATSWQPTKLSVATARHLYKKVAEIDAVDLDDVFRIGNIGPEENIKRLDKMHSVSVGDVIVNKEFGNAVVVASFGFDFVDF